MKTLVKINPASGRFIEIDTIRLAREAKLLLDYIKLNINDKNDIHEIRRLVIPLCEKALRGEIKVAMPIDDIPLQYQIKERLLSEDFVDLFADFYITATGTPEDEINPIDINGDKFTYLEFEE